VNTIISLLFITIILFVFCIMFYYVCRCIIYYIKKENYILSIVTSTETICKFK